MWNQMKKRKKRKNQERRDRDWYLRQGELVAFFFGLAGITDGLAVVIKNVGW
jgi:hypothetical protein